MVDPGPLYLGLATAIAAVTASAVGLGLLRPARPLSRWVSLAVVLAAVLGIAAAFIAVATERPTGLLHVVIALGLLAPGGYVLIRAVDSIMHHEANDDAALDGIRFGSSLPGGVPTAHQPGRSRRVFLAACGYAIAVAALLAIATPGLLETILRPDDPTSEALGGYTPSHRPVFSCLEGGADCPGPGYATFNSYRNAPIYGDERGFVDAKPDRIRTAGGYQDVLEVAPGEVIVIRCYVNNSGDARFEERPGASIARGTRLLVLLPYGRRSPQAVAGQITADNAIPPAIGDTVTLVGTADFGIRYIPGSARLYNSIHPNGMRVPDSVVSDGTHRTNGALLGFRRLDGRIAGSFEQSALVTLKVAID